MTPEDLWEQLLEAEEADLESGQAKLLEMERQLQDLQNRMAEASRIVEKEEQALISARHQSDSLEKDRVRLTEERRELLARKELLAAEVSEVAAQELALEKEIAEATEALNMARECRGQKEGECRELQEDLVDQAGDLVDREES